MAVNSRDEKSDSKAPVFSAGVGHKAAPGGGFSVLVQLALDACPEILDAEPSVSRPHRLSVRTGDSQSSKRGSIPRGGANSQR